MNPESYTFVAPIEVPTIRGGRHGGFFDIVSDGSATYQLRWRSLEDWPLVVRESTGEEGRLVLSVRNDVSNIPRHGRVTLTFEQCIAVEDGARLYDSWDENDWKLREPMASPAGA